MTVARANSAHAELGPLRVGVEPLVPVEDTRVARADFEPQIVGFLCRWCSYPGADLAGTSRLAYSPSLRVIRVPCSGRVDPLFVLKAFQEGADGVMVLGCHPGDCHYLEGNYYARRRWAIYRKQLEFMGFDLRRIKFTWISAAEGRKFADEVAKYVGEVRALGPFKQFHEIIPEKVS